MQETIWDAHKVAEELLNVLPQLSRIMMRHVQSLDVDEATLMQVRVLFLLTEHEVCTTSDLAKRQKVTLQSASVQVQGLVDRGWVMRVPDPKDRRQFLLQVTPEGLASAKQAKDQIINFISGFMIHLTPDEVAAAQVFLPALKRVSMEEPKSGTS